MGTYSQSSTNVEVYFRNLATDKLHRMKLTTGLSGEMDLTPVNPFMPNTTYRVWVTTSPTDSFEDMVSWTLPDGITSVTCILIKMESIEFNGDDRVSDANVGLVAA